MQTFTAKPVAPETVQAIQYVAPNLDETGGNVDELLAVEGVEQQNPWDPTLGQNCLLADGLLIQDGSYLVVHDGGFKTVTSAADFTAAYVADSKAS